MKIDISKILFDKFKSRSLAHFYILKAAPAIQNKAQFLRDWIETFLHACVESDIQEQKKGPNPKGHLQSKNALKGLLTNGLSDILIIEKEDADSDYVLSDFDELFRFQNHVPLDLTHRFIVVFDAHQIKPIILNKLLKLLEEPQKKSTILFVNPSYNKILPTILSRAVTFVIPDLSNPKEINKSLGYSFRNDDDISKDANNEQILSWFDEKITTKKGEHGYYLSKKIKEALMNLIAKKEGESNLVELLAKDKSHINTFLLLLIEWERSNLSNYQQKAKFLSEINWFKKALTYNNPPQERLFSLLTTLLPEHHQSR